MQLSFFFHHCVTTNGFQNNFDFSKFEYPTKIKLSKMINPSIWFQNIRKAIICDEKDFNFFQNKFEKVEKLIEKNNPKKLIN